MAELFLELFSEEIPARMQVEASQNLGALLIHHLGQAGVKTGATYYAVGPRRLAIAFEKIVERTPPMREEKKGPRVGAPETAVEGFLKSAGLTSLDQCEKQSDAKGEFYVAVIERPGRDVRELLAEIVPAVCDAMPWPKSMRSGARPERWVRPLKRIVCLLDGKVVPLEWAGVPSGDETEGHRVHGKGPFRVKDFASYKSTLETKGHVLIDWAERRQLIHTKANQLCVEAGLELVADEKLLREVAGLAEWPVPLLGEFDPKFLDLPPEVIQLTMAKNQKYFAVRDPKKATGLAPRFVAIADLEPTDGGKASAKGYARVLSARLSDARFFWDEDRARSLESRVEDLASVVFHRKLGSVKDKAERVSALARELAPLCRADPDLAARAGLLAKADLTTSMVQEFTDLQGVMGSYYVLADAGSKIPPPPAGEGDHEVVEGAAAAQIAQAIREHYSPLGPTDDVPTAPVSVAVALADKLDTLVAFWAIDEKPTGSKDPYALRRAALGVIRVVLENRISLPLFMRLRNSFVREEERMADAALDKKLEALFEVPADWINRAQAEAIAGREIFDNLFSGGRDERFFKAVANTRDLLAFFADRLKVVLREEGVRHDLIDAVFALGEDDLVAIVARVRALQSFLSTPDGENLLAGARRASNILDAEAKKTGFDPATVEFRGAEMLQAAEEKALAKALDEAAAKAKAAVEAEDYEGAMRAIAPLRPAIDAFFDKVTVNSADPELRANRLKLLSRIREALGAVADFSKIGG